MNSLLYYIHDPMCSWCWAFKPVWDQIKAQLPDQINIIYVAGGLAPDTDDAMPESMQKTIQGYWHSIQQQLGTEFNFDFWMCNTPRRSTFPACRAVIAASLQHFETLMTFKIQQGYYLWAMNPSDDDVLISLAKRCHQDLPHLDIDQFVHDLHSEQVQLELNRQIILARELTPNGFPSLVFEHKNIRTLLSHDYRSSAVVLSQVKKLMNA